MTTPPNTPNTPVSGDEEIVDSVMGIIIANSTGLVDNMKGEGYAYAEGVYLNNVKTEVSTLLALKDQQRDEAVREAMSDYLMKYPTATLADYYADTTLTPPQSSSDKTD